MNEMDERLLLSALVDGEPVSVDSPPSTALLRRAAVLRSLRDAVRRNAARHRAPASLRATVERIVREHGPAPRRRSWSLPFAFASVCVAAVLSSVATFLFLKPASSDALENQVVSAHLRTLMSPSPVQVASSDQHTVKPWFAGRLSYTLPVADLKDQGFALLGGGIEVFDGKPVAALLYQHRKHLIDVYVLPAEQYARFASLDGTQRNGFNLVAYTESGFGYLAVSDLNAEELRRLPVLLSRAAQ